MHATKDNSSWVSYLTSTLIVALIIGGLWAKGEFEAYSAWQAELRSRTTVPDLIVASETAQTLCADEVPSNKLNCFQSLKQARTIELRAQHGLLAQQDMAVWSFGVLLTSFFGLFFSAGGFVALVWTFRETRKMTQAQDRAYLALGTGEIIHDGTYGLNYALEVHNSGNTPATYLFADLTLTLTFPDPNDQANKKVESYPIAAALNEVPAKSAGRLSSGYNGDILDLPDGLLGDYGSHYRKTGTIISGDDGVDHVEASIEVTGTISYFDVFGGEHKIQTAQFSRSLTSDDWRLRNRTQFLNFI